MAPQTRKLVEWVYLALLAALVAVPVAGVIWWFIQALQTPWGLDYNEGIVWKQMAEIVAGRGYAPIDRFPAIVFHYPPVFHLATAGVAQTGLDPLISGRVVSLVSTIGSMLIVGDLARRLVTPGRPLFAWVAMVAAMVFFLLFEAVHTWAPQMRVDAIACFFALAGLWCITRSDDRPALIYLAALFFVLSVFSKQVSVVTAAAAFGALLLLRPQRAVRAIAATVLLGLVVLAVLAWHTEGRIFNHLFLYNINRFEASRLLPNMIGSTGTDVEMLVIGSIGYLALLAGAWKNRQRWKEMSLLTGAMLLFLPLATLSLVTSGKYGSSSSYYTQWVAAMAIHGGVMVAWIVKAASEQLGRGTVWRAAAWAAIPLLVAFRLFAYSDSWHLGVIEIRNADSPRIIQLLEPVKGDIISDDMVILMRMGREIVWEPAIFAELAAGGKWDEQLVVEQIRNGRIGAVVTTGDRGSKWFDERYNPDVATAMADALPRKIAVGVRVVHLPASAPEAISEIPTSGAAESR